MEPQIKYYAYIRKSIKGPFFPQEICQLQGFTKNTLVCPEKALGQWREARMEKAFQYYLSPSKEPTPPPEQRYQQERTSLRPVLEKVLRQNSEFEREIKSLRREYAEEKRRFEKVTAQKENEIKSLVEKLKKVRLRMSVKEEHPSWEVLYKTYKKRAEEKIAQALETIAEKSNEISRIREKYGQDISRLKTDNDELKKEYERKAEKLNSKIKELTSEMEEKEIIIKSFDENMRSIMGKNEELQKILFEERSDYESRIKNFCSEIGTLKSEIKWKDREIEKIKTELNLAIEKIREFESLNSIKTREQKEIYNALKMKIKILAGYFENLESRIKYAFKKA